MDALELSANRTVIPLPLGVVVQLVTLLITSEPVD